MKHYEKVTVPEKVEDRLDHTTCDLCGRTTTNTRNWDLIMYEVNDTEVSIEHGSCYPEGGSGTRTEFDICPNCFTNKLVPWLYSQGAKPRETSLEW